MYINIHFLKLWLILFFVTHISKEWEWNYFDLLSLFLISPRMVTSYYLQFILVKVWTYFETGVSHITNTFFLQ